MARLMPFLDWISHAFGRSHQVQWTNYLVKYQNLYGQFQRFGLITKNWNDFSFRRTSKEHENPEETI